MYCYRKVSEDLYWIGGNDRRTALFEGIYPIPGGVSYNSYLLMDEKIVIFDTVDRAVADVFLENVEELLQGKTPDFVVVHHMEPDHSATLKELVLKYPDVKIICNAKSAAMMKQFFAFDVDKQAVLVSEGDTICFGRHNVSFVMAPMVHWPEVMVSYDKTDKILFSADAFGTFGALDGALFADEVDFDRDYLDEARRYYTNIVGKYGVQVQAALKKLMALDIDMICPLHGFVWRKALEYYIQKYDAWSSYRPEKQGVMIAYASVYGNTANAAEILACELREKGIETEMYDLSTAEPSEVLAAAFKWSHMVLASITYNGGLFTPMDRLCRELASHNIQNRTIALIENGSWAPCAAKLMREALEKCKNLTFIEAGCSIKSSVKEQQRAETGILAERIKETLSL